MTVSEKKQNKKDAIYDAALKLIAQNGFHGTSTAAIAEEAGVGVGSIYRYFKNKDELIRQLFHHLKAEENRVIMESHDPEAPIRDQYIQLNAMRIDYIVQHPKSFRFFEQFFNSPYGLHHRRIVLSGDGICKKMSGHPLALIFNTAVQQKIVKDLPLVVLMSLTAGPVIFYIRDVHAGVIGYSKQAALQLIEATWDAIKL